MAAPAYHIGFIPLGKTAFIWKPEMSPDDTPTISPSAAYTTACGAGTGVAGTPQSLSASNPAYREGCNDITWNPQRTDYTNTEYDGSVQVTKSHQESAHHSAMTISLPYRSSGFAAFCLMSMLGDITISKTGYFMASTFRPSEVDASGFKHLGITGYDSTRINTFTIWYDTGDPVSGRCLRVAYFTPESIRLTWPPDGMVQAEISGVGYWPQRVARPSYRVVAQPTNRTPGSEGKYTIYGSNDVALTNLHVHGGDLTVMRNVEVFHTSELFDATDKLNPYDFISGEIQFAATFDMIFNGVGTPGVFGDYLDDEELGGATAMGTALGNGGLPYINDSGDTFIHKVKFGDNYDPRNTFELSFFPAKWNNPTINRQGNAIKINAGLASYQQDNEPQSDDTGAHHDVVTTLYSIEMENQIGFPMVA